MIATARILLVTSSFFVLQTRKVRSSALTAAPHTQRSNYFPVVSRRHKMNVRVPKNRQNPRDYATTSAASFTVNNTLLSNRYPSSLDVANNRVRTERLKYHPFRFYNSTKSTLRGEQNTTTVTGPKDRCETARRRRASRFR